MCMHVHMHAHTQNLAYLDGTVQLGDKESQGQDMVCRPLYIADYHILHCSVDKTQHSKVLQSEEIFHRMRIDCNRYFDTKDL